MDSNKTKKSRIRQKDIKFDLKTKSEKPIGQSEGFTYKTKGKVSTEGVKSGGGRTYLLKPLAKARPKKENDQLLRGDAIREYIAGDILKELIGKAAAKTQLIVDLQNPGTLEVSSQYFMETESLNKVLASQGSIVINNFEEILASCLAVSDFDIHGDNLHVSKGPTVKRRMYNEKKKAYEEIEVQTYNLHKLDHGKAFSRPLGTFKEEIARLNELFNVFQYSNITISNLNIDKFYKQIEEKQKKLKEVYRTSLSRSFADLAINGITFIPEVDLEKDQNGDNVRRYIHVLEQNIKAMEAFKNHLEVISKFNNVSQAFKDGLWIKLMNGVENPLIFAIENNLTIEGKDPIEWYAQHKQLDIIELVKNNPIIARQFNARFKNLIVWQIDNDIPVDETQLLNAMLNAPSREETTIALALSDNIKAQNILQKAVKNPMFKHEILNIIIKQYQTSKSSAERDKLENGYNELIKAINNGKIITLEDVGIIGKADARTIAFKLNKNLELNESQYFENDKIKDFEQTVRRLYIQALETQELKLTMKQIAIGNELKKIGGAFEGLKEFINRVANFFTNLDVKATSKNVVEGYKRLDELLIRSAPSISNKISKEKISSPDLAKFAKKIALSKLKTEEKHR